MQSTKAQASHSYTNAPLAVSSWDFLRRFWFSFWSAGDLSISCRWCFFFSVAGQKWVVGLVSCGAPVVLSALPSRDFFVVGLEDELLELARFGMLFVGGVVSAIGEAGGCRRSSSRHVSRVARRRRRCYFGNRVLLCGSRPLLLSGAFLPAAKQQLKGGRGYFSSSSAGCGKAALDLLSLPSLSRAWNAGSPNAMETKAPVRSSLCLASPWSDLRRWPFVRSLLACLTRADCCFCFFQRFFDQKGEEGCVPKFSSLQQGMCPGFSSAII